MSRPLSRPEATAARLQHEADQWAACWIAVTGHEQPVGDQRTAPWDDRPENTVIHFGTDELARLSSPLPIHINGTASERAAFLLNLAGSLDEAAALLLADGAA